MSWSVSLPIAACRFVGYRDRPPYLWLVDLERLTLEPAAADAISIPQAIDDVVRVAGVVGVRCGPRWFQLPVDLSGTLVLAADDRAVEFERQSRLLRVESFGAEASVVVDATTVVSLHDDRIVRWGKRASLSPDGTALALAGCTIEAHRREEALVALPFEEMLGVSYEPYPWMMFRVEVATGVVVAYETVFDNFAYAVAWTKDGDGFAFGTPFEPSVIWVATRDGTALTRVSFPVSVAMPLIDAGHLPELTHRLDSTPR